MPLHPPIRPLVRLSLAVAVVAGLAVTAPGQVRMRRLGPQGFIADPTADGEAHDDKDAPVGVTVPDSPGAMERLAHGAEKEQQKQWKVAADFYREAVTQFGGRVVPADASTAPRGPTAIYRFSGVAAAVQERIAKWPPEGLTVYRNLYGPAAADRLAGAPRGDLATLGSIFFDDFVTDAGKAAGLRLMDAYSEAGDFPAAAAIGDRLLDLHPLLGADRPTVLFRTALADHWGGDDAAAGKRLADLRQSDPKAVGSVGGKDVVLVDALAASIVVPAPRPAVDPMAADTYPSFGGPGGRGDVSPSTAKPGASLNTVVLAPPDFSSMAGAQRANLVQRDGVSLNNGEARGVMPVVDAGTLFFQDGRAVYAVDADSGMPVTSWLTTYPGAAGGRYHLPGPGRARGEELTVTVTPSAVLAVMGQRDPLMATGAVFNGGGLVMQGNDGQASPVRLVCLDRATGRELWKVSPADLPDAAGAVKAGEYDGTPLSVPAAVAGTPEDAVLAVVRGGRDGQFDNCYVVCLSARTGRFRWSTYIGSGTRLSNDGEATFGSDPSQLSLADGRAFVMSNLGTVAALDPADGRVVWLDAYARDNAEALQDALQRQQMGNGGPVGNNKPWARNPAVVQGGRVFALPTDARELLVLDAATGRQLKRIETKDYDNANVLLGLHEEPSPSGTAVQTVVLTADKQVYGIDWQSYDPAQPARAVRLNELTIYGADSGDTSDTSDCSVAGRGFLTADAIFVTTKRQLFQFGWRHGHGHLQAVYPTNGKFSGGQGPGNVLVTSQNVVVAGQDRVDVYTDLGLVTAKYDREMRAAPTDPQPRVRFATALFAGGQTADALARIDQAIDLVGGEKSMRVGAGRAMVFNVLLDFGRRLSQPVAKDQPADPKTVELANALFDRAADAAAGPDQQVAYLLARARFEHAVTQGYGAEVELCQRVLADPALRAVNVTDEQTAAAAASSEIGSAIAVDRSAYAPVEARAVAALADARGRGDPGALMAVADVYPNSGAAVEARRAAVDRYQATGRPGEAIGVLRQMYAAAGDPVAKAGVLELIAADFLATGPDGVGPAVDRLAAAAQVAKFNPLLASDLKLPDGFVLRGRSATYGDAVASLRGTLAAADAARLPDFRLSTQAEAIARYAERHNGDRRAEFTQLSPFLPGATQILDVTALVHPARDFNRNDRVVTWSSTTGLSVFDVAQSTPRFRAAGVTEVPLGAAWVGGRDPARGRWVVWTPTGLTALTDGGRPAWPTSLAVQDLSGVPAVSDGGGAVVDDAPAGNDPDAIQQQAVINGQLVNVRVIGGGRRLMVFRGNQVIPAPAAPPPVALAGGERIISAVPAGGGGDVVLATTTTGRLVAVDTVDGKVRWQTRPADRAPDAVVANGHFAVARLDDAAAGATIVVFDMSTGRVVGRRKFGADGQPNQLVNLALGEEGTLAITLANVVEVKDLYDAWPLQPTPLVARANQDPAGYLGMSQPDQLLVRAGRVVTLYDAGRYARSYDLSRPADSTAPASTTNPTNPLATKAATATGPANVWLRLDGSRLFIVQPAAVLQYNLADPTDTCTEVYLLGADEPKIRGLLMGTDHVIAVHDPVDRGPAPSPRITLMAFSRAPRPGTTRMSGTLDFCFTIPSTSGVADWSAVDGGVYVLFGNHRLALLRGGGDAPVP